MIKRKYVLVINKEIEFNEIRELCCLHEDAVKITSECEKTRAGDIRPFGFFLEEIMNEIKEDIEKFRRREFNED